MRYSRTAIGLFMDALNDSIIPIKGKKRSDTKIRLVDILDYGINEELAYSEPLVTIVNKYDNSSAASKVMSHSRDQRDIDEEIKKEYEKREAVYRFSERFASQIAKRIYIDPFIKRLLDILDWQTISQKGRLYLTGFLKEIPQKDEYRKNTFRFISELFVYSILDREPDRWAQDYDVNNENIKGKVCAGAINFPFKRNKHFIERATLKNSELIALLAHQDIISFYGVTGCGKTQVALSLGYTLSEQHSVIWLDASSITSLISSIKESLNVIGIYPHYNTSSNILHELIRYIEGNQKTILIFDNYYEEAYYNALGLEYIIANIKNAKAIITSQKYVEIDDAYNICVKEFEECDSLEYLSNRLKHISSNDLAHLKELANRLYNQPLALAQACSYLIRNPHMSIEDYIQLLNETELRVLQGNSHISMHKAAIYDSILLSMEYVKRINASSFAFMRIFSFFPERNISSVLLNRALFHPYFFNKGNYKFDKTRKIATPFLYSNCGSLAIDKEAKKFFDSINLPMYDKRLFLEMIGTLEDFDLCRIKYHDKKETIENENIFTQFNFFKNISAIFMHGLVQELICSSIINGDESQAIDTISNIFQILNLSGRRKPYMLLNEHFSMFWYCRDMVSYLTKYKEEFLSEKYMHVCMAAMSMSATLIHTDIYSMGGFNSEYTKDYQDEIWDYILEFHKKNCSLLVYRIRELEYCLLFPIKQYEKSRERFNDAIKIIMQFNHIDINQVHELINEVYIASNRYEYEFAVYNLVIIIFGLLGIDFKRSMVFLFIQMGDETKNEILKIFNNERVNTPSIDYAGTYMNENRGEVAFVPSESRSPSDGIFIDHAEISALLAKEVEEIPQWFKDSFSS